MANLQFRSASQSVTMISARDASASENLNATQRFKYLKFRVRWTMTNFGENINHEKCEPYDFEGAVKRRVVQIVQIFLLCHSA